MNPFIIPFAIDWGWNGGNWKNLGEAEIAP